MNEKLFITSKPIAPSPPFAGEEAPGWTDEDLFKEPPPNEDWECPICFLQLPVNKGEIQYYSCCGNVVCRGCAFADITENNRTICTFCRAPAPTSERERVKRLKKRVDADDFWAINQLGCCYSEGKGGLRRDYGKAMELWLRAGELGCIPAYNNVGFAYSQGRGVESDSKKTLHFYGLAAVGGNVLARHNLGLFEKREGNVDRAFRHWMIAAGAGYDKSLTKIREGFLKGDVTKDNFEKALRTHQAAKDEMKSGHREAYLQAITNK